MDRSRRKPCTDLLFSPEIIERLAEAYHERYRDAGDVTPDGNRPWVHLPDHLKEVNRASARAIPDHVGFLGYEARPSSDSTRAVITFSEAQVERAAQVEHERWMGHKASHGYVHGPERADTAQPPSHPAIVSWAELDEPTREKDRRRIRDIPKLLAQLGYELASMPDRGRRDESAKGAG
jgi:hypothetical protein